MIFTLHSFHINAKTKVVSTEYIYQIPENVSPDQAREIAITRARAQAIADEFGTNVSSRTSVVVENSNGNSNVDFFSLGGSELKGEWIEDIEKPTFEYITDGTSMALKVKVKGRIREISGSKVEADIKILRNGVNDANESEMFEVDDDLYISFNSPTNGYLAIYLIDSSQNAYCLLPYPSQSDGIFKIRANEKYVFFHPDYAKGVNPSEVERLVVDTESETERDRIL
ncbi:MAG: DUF4384 domain-containing protein, partial [Muribaculaceae bacterium]|nr:DUF4384 domain-containing protein [Muribaculaceae bacterium]